MIDDVNNGRTISYEWMRGAAGSVAIHIDAGFARRRRLPIAMATL